MTIRLLAFLLFIPSLCFTQTEGCTYPDADNYSPLATTDDGSCTFQGGTYYHPTTISTAIFDPCGGDGLLRDEAIMSSSWTLVQYQEALTKHIENMGFGKVLILEMHQELTTPEFDGYGLDWISNSTIGSEWQASCAYSASEGDWIPSITIAFTNPCAISDCQGCTDPTALNYAVQANLNDGSCLYPLNYCGEGTVWNEELGGCIVENPTDTDLDGCTGVDDVLDVLATFGMCYSEEPVEAWECGDTLEYWGYWYETVQIGEQCWLAENLQNARYANGDTISSELTSVEWTTATFGANAIFGQGNSTCSQMSPDFDACDYSQSFTVYGRLYNWYTTEDSRGLCPNNWHIPSDGEWSAMADALGGREGAGLEIKTTFGWTEDGNGSNTSGFSGLPAGGRDHSSGSYWGAGNTAYWWSETESGSQAMYQDLNANYNYLNHAMNLKTLGFSVRCLKD